jgi:hypothetical protein
MSAFDKQVNGNHYKLMMIQPLEYALANDLGICEHAVVKYISRWKMKGGVDDSEESNSLLRDFNRARARAALACKPAQRR